MSKKFNANLPSMNTACDGCAAAQGGKIFVVGGTGREAMFDIATQKWVTIVPMSTARIGTAAVSFGGKIVVMGGLNGDEYYEYMILSSVEQYDPFSEQWASLPSMNKQRQGCAAADVDGKIVVVGGRDRRNFFACGEEFDPDTQKWSEIPPMHFKRNLCAAAVLDGQLYVMGGYDNNNGKYLSSAEAYNPTTKQWTLINDMTTPRSGCAAVSLGGRIVVVGGYNGSEYYLCSCESYNPTTQRWSSVPSMNTERSQCSAVEVEGTLYMLGGHDERNCHSSIEYLPYCAFFACQLDEQPDLVKDLDIDDTIMPFFLSFVGRHCKMLAMWRVIQSRQDLLTI